MKNTELMNAIDRNYDFIMSLDGRRNVQMAYGYEMSHKKDELKVGNVMSFQNHRHPCELKAILIIDETRTVFLSYTEVDLREEDENGEF